MEIVVEIVQKLEFNSVYLFAFACFKEIHSSLGRAPAPLEMRVIMALILAETIEAEDFVFVDEKR